jgi:AcrR family transcriptional regulator
LKEPGIVDTVAVAAPNRRERTRLATIDEIKQTALTLMRERSTTDVRFADIARAMGLTPQALYRYFADRDELLTAMIVDAFGHLGESLASARDSAGTTDLGELLFATASAYRHWARSDPQRFSLVFGLPAPEFVAPEEGPTTEAARRAMANLEGLVGLAAVAGEAVPPLIAKVGEALVTDIADKQCGSEFEIPAATYQAMLHSWAMLHGFVSLEAYGHLNWLSDTGRDEMFRTLTVLAAQTMGVPAPPTDSRDSRAK